MTYGDDEKRPWRAVFDAAIGPTPPAPDRMRAVAARYAGWRRRRRILLSTGAASFAALAVAGAGIAVALGPARSTRPPDTTPVISSTATPSPPSVSPSPSRSAPLGSASESPTPSSTPTPTTPRQSASASGDTSGLRGVVVDEAGKPLPHIYVNSQHGVTQTDANGQFVAPVSNGHHGACLLFTSQPLSIPQRGAPPSGDYAWQAWPAPNTSNCAPEVNANLRIVMRPGADVFGTLRDTAGNPVAGAVVYSSIPVGFMSAGMYSPLVAAVTDSQGRYRIYGDQQGEPAGISLNLDPQTAIGSSGTAGSGTPVDVTDYGQGCNTVFPLPSCPNAAAAASANAAATPQATPSPAPS